MGQVTGYYAFGNLVNDNYVIAPQNDSYVFNPVTRSVAIPQTNIQAYDFTATGIYSINGTVTGAIQEGVSVSIYKNECGGNTLLDTITTDSNGSYIFTSLLKGAYTVIPIKTGYALSPTSQSVTVSENDVTEVDFISEN